MSTQDLLNNGYKAFEYRNQRSYEWLYQKRIRDNKGQTLYFVNVEMWEFPSGNRFSFTTNFYLDGAKINNFEVRFCADNCTVAYIEDFARTLYISMGCVPDKDNND